GDPRMMIETDTEVRVRPDRHEEQGLLRRLMQSGWFMAIASPVLMLLIWEILVRAGLLDSRFFPPPSSVIAELFKLILSGELWVRTAYTVSRMLVGFFLGAVPAVFLGIVMGLSPTIRAFFQPAISSIYPIPKIALFPLVMLIF